MPSDPAETTSEAGRSRLWVAGLVLCAIGVGVGLFLLLRPETAVLPDTPGRAPAVAFDRGDASTQLLSELEEALVAGTPAELRALAASRQASWRELRDVRANVRALDIDRLSLRYVDEGSGADTGLGPRFGEQAWVAVVQLEWGLAGVHRKTSALEVTMSMVQEGDDAAFVSARPDHGEPAPLWLLDRLDVARSATSLVMAAGREDADDYLELADKAVRDVRAVLPRWRDRLVVEVPASGDDLERAVAAGDDSYDAIAAVTTPVDGTVSPGAPTHVFVNRSVFDPLGPQGAQIVMSHEAVHVATDAPVSTMPTWLLEGFADYIALVGVDLPVDVTASQILAQVRDDGAPERLPGKNDFGAKNILLGASYEAAWLACRLLADTYGQPALLEFYDRADESGETRTAFRQVFGTDQAAFTRAWTRELERLAD